MGATNLNRFWTGPVKWPIWVLFVKRFLVWCVVAKSLYTLAAHFQNHFGLLIESFCKDTIQVFQTYQSFSCQRPRLFAQGTTALLLALAVLTTRLCFCIVKVFPCVSTRTLSFIVEHTSISQGGTKWSCVLFFIFDGHLLLLRSRQRKVAVAKVLLLELGRRTLAFQRIFADV